MRSHRIGAPLWAACVAALLWTAPAVAAPPPDSVPDDLTDVGVREVLNVQIPLDLEFTDSSGRGATLAECFDGTHPVVLTMNYSNCPMLCSLQLNGLFEALGKVPWDLGNQYRMVTVSIDHKETAERAQATKEKYLKVYGRPGAAEGWHYLTGNERSIRNLADTVGFGFKYLPDKDQYSHAAVFMVCTPDGRVSRYVYGVKFEPETVRLALVEAGEGKVGSVSDRVLMFCYQYDPQSGSYVPAAWNIMRAGGVLVLLGLGSLIGGLVIVRRVRTGKSPLPSAQAAKTPQETPRGETVE